MRVITIVLCCVLFASCSLFDKTDTLPVFIDVDSVDLETSDMQGSESHKISDLWMFSEGQSLGVFELPCSAPFISDEGPVIVTFAAGVKNNGMQGEVAEYPFFQRIDREIDYVNGLTIEPELTFSYRNDIQIRLVEDFEDNHIFTKDADDDEDTNFTVSSETVKEGTLSGHMRVDTMNRIMEVATQFFMENVPTNNSPVYLELDYKNDILFDIGLLGEFGGQTAKGYWITLVPTEEWNKIYIELTDLLVQSQLPNYSILFRIRLPTDSDQMVGNTFVDNVKFIHF